MSGPITILVLFISLTFASLYMLDRVKTPRMTLADIDALEDQLLSEAFANAISVVPIYAGDKNTGPDGDYLEDEDEDDYIENPAFTLWAEQQTKLIMSLSKAQRDTFVRSGKLPKGFKYSGPSPDALIHRDLV